VCFEIPLDPHLGDEVPSLALLYCFHIHEAHQWQLCTFLKEMKMKWEPLIYSAYCFKHILCSNIIYVALSETYLYCSQNWVKFYSFFPVSCLWAHSLAEFTFQYCITGVFGLVVLPLWTCEVVLLTLPSCDITVVKTVAELEGNKFIYCGPFSVITVAELEGMIPSHS
jgi:hypothetical protein